MAENIQWFHIKQKFHTKILHPILFIHFIKFGFGISKKKENFGKTWDLFVQAV